MAKVDSISDAEAWAAPETTGALSEPCSNVKKAELDLGTVAERVVDRFYEAQRSRFERERARLEKSGTGTISPSKWNRQEIYLDGEQYERARLASRRHLARHPTWLRGRYRLSRDVLRDIVAVQHYVDVDLEDLCLPVKARRSQDVFDYKTEHVCHQLLLDAPRSRFVVDGKVFDFAQERAARQHAGDGQASSGDANEADSFCDRLVAAVVCCLGDKCPPVVLRAVTTAMSQSGLANMERALEFPQVVVGGGESDVAYELKSLGGGVWDLTLSVHKHGFEQCIVYSSFDPENRSTPDPRPMACGSSSSILKELSLRYSIVPGSSGKDDAGVPADFQIKEESSSWFAFAQGKRHGEGNAFPGERFQADVQSLRKEYHVVDAAGRPLPGFGPLWCSSLRQPLRLIASILQYFCTEICGGCAEVCGGSLIGNCFGSCAHAVQLAMRTASRIIRKVMRSTMVKTASARECSGAVEMRKLKP